MIGDRLLRDVRLDNRTAVVTGASSGIGLETARELVGRGARVILACRDVDKGESVRRELASKDVVVMKLDLSSMASIRSFADEFNRKETRLDILVNNAGIFASNRRLTEDGFEVHFGTNHLGHMYLTLLLLNKLKSSAPSRIVTLSSKGHEYYKLNFADLQMTRGWSPVKAYGCSKTANVLFSVYLGKLLQGSGVTTYCVHPGIVRTKLAREFDGSSMVKCFNWVWTCCCCGLLSPAEGAMTTIYCCVDQGISNDTGLYYSTCRRKHAKRHATDLLLAERLWNTSLDMCGLDKHQSIFNMCSTYTTSEAMECIAA